MVHTKYVIYINKSKPSAKYFETFLENCPQNGSNPVWPLFGPEGPQGWSRRIQPSAEARKGP